MAVQHMTPSKSDEEIKTSFVREDGQATIICPACSTAKNISVQQFRNRRYRLKVKCTCLHVFKNKLEYRQSYRKPTDLSGTYSIYPPGDDKWAAKISNLSLGGICFEVTSIHSLQVGQKGNIEFTLDNKKKTQLKKNFTIRAVMGNKIGCKFEKDLAYEKDLGFYLRS